MHCNQSTISRRKSKVLSVFNTSAKRGNTGWIVEPENGSLLVMERRVHQVHRLTKSRRLRIHIPFWSHCIIRPFLPHEVISNPPDASILCDNVMDLLRAHVIDACILTPTQLKGVNTEDLQLVDLYRSQINLYHIQSPGALTCVINSSSGIPDNSRLCVAEFLPQSCKDACLYRYRQLIDKPCNLNGDSKIYNLSFMTPVMARSFPNAYEMKGGLEWPYTETLVFLKSLSSEPEITKIIDRTREAFALNRPTCDLDILI